MRKTISKCALMLLFVNSVLVPSAPAIEDQSCSNNFLPQTTPSSDFTVMGDGSVVRHEVTNLEWQRCTHGQAWNGSSCTGIANGLNWRNALAAATALGDGWRLPNINELRSIVEECRSGPAINRKVFPNTPPDMFWTSSPRIQPSSGPNALYVNFNNGIDIYPEIFGGTVVRFVRDVD